MVLAVTRILFSTLKTPESGVFRAVAGKKERDFLTEIHL